MAYLQRHAENRRTTAIYAVAALLFSSLLPLAVSQSSAAAPSATSVTPSSGAAIGGTTVAITGTEFSASNVSQVADVFLETLSGDRYSMSFEVVSETVVSASTPVMGVDSQSPGVGAIYLTFTDASEASVPFTLIPTVASVTPSSGTAAGGNTITISGTAFFSSISKIVIGSDEILPANFTVVNSTTITASIPVRQTSSKTVGAKRVVVEYGGAVSSSDQVRYSFFPARDASQDRLGPVILGELGSRTQRKLISRTTLAPFEVVGIDSLTNQSYTYVTNINYGTGTAYAREGHQPGFTKYRSGSNLLTTTNPSLSTKEVTSKAAGTTFTDRNNRSYDVEKDSIVMRSAGSCGFNTNTFDSGDGQGSVTTYCSVYGPEVYSEVFYGRAGQSLAFDWLAVGETDDASIYGWLVSVDNESTIPYTDVNSHILLVHSVQSRTAVSPWQTSTGAIPFDGLYRFRFTNGSYDGTGGWAIGSTFLLSSVYEAGLTQDINFGPIQDQIGAANATFTVSATATNGGEVTITSRTTSVCTVTTSHSGGVTEVTITKKTTGTCQLLASKDAEGEYAPASDKLVAFEIRSAATKATAPIITTVTPGNQQLTVDFTRPSRDGGLAIVNYQYSTDNGSTWVSVSPASTNLQILIQNKSSDGASLSNGVTYSLKVRALTDTTSAAIAEGTASNTGTGTPNAPNIPILDYATDTITRNQGSVTQILAPDNSGGSVTTYAISSGTLPPGLSLNTSTGIISGNPNTQGSYTVTVTGTNSSGTSDPTTLSITITPPAANPPSLTWEIGAASTYTVEVGDTLTTAAPSNSNTVDSAVFAVSPALPSGLSINSSTGVISGSPDEPISATTFTITATNGAGSSQVTLTITVTLAAPAISPNSALTLYVGSSTNQSPPTNTGGRISVWTISPELPSGLSLNSSTGVLSGTPSDAASATDYTLSAGNASGTSSITLTITILVPAVPSTPAEPRKPGAYTGPNPTLFVPRVLEASTSYTVKVEGERLDQVTSMTHKGVKLQFKIISAREIEVQIPPLTSGVKEVRFDYRGGGIVSYLNALVVQPPRPTSTATDSATAPVNPTPPVSDLPFNRLTITGFVPGRTTLTATGWRQFGIARARLRESGSELNCVGYTMGPTILSRDIKLSFDRASYICNLLKRAIPRLDVQKLEGRQDLRVGDRIRRVEIEWR